MNGLVNALLWWPVITYVLVGVLVILGGTQAYVESKWMRYRDVIFAAILWPAKIPKLFE